MSQVKIIHRQIRLIVIYFTLLISACNGQEQTQKSRIESSKVDSEYSRINYRKYSIKRTNKSSCKKDIPR
jgi:hypothetical protein